MQDPKFEKQVQQKMEELKFSPSDAVWTNIEAGINTEKKRRKPFFWLFFLLGLSIAAGGYFIMNKTNKGAAFKTKEDISKQETSRQETSKQEDASEQGSGKEEKRKTQGASGQTAIGNNNNATKKLIPGNETEKSNTARTLNAPDHSIVNGQQKRSSPSSYQKNTIVISGKQKKNKTKAEQNENEITTEDDVIAKSNSYLSNDRREKKNYNNIDAAPLKDSSALSSGINSPDKKTNGITEKKPAGIDSLNNNTTIAKTSDKNKKKHAWRIGFTVAPGVSNIAGGLFKSAYLNVNPAPAYSSAVSPLNVTATRTTEIPLAMDVSFAAGVLAQKKLSKRVLVSVGINYHYYSVKTVVGKYIDTSRTIFSPQLSTVQNYYSDTAVSNYTNHYHFIELPLLFSFQLNKNIKKPVLWEAGLSFSYLVGTNAFQHDQLSHVYYKDNGLFNKMQVAGTTGLLFGFNAGKNQLQIGPEIQYGLTRLLDKTANYPEHLFFGGIKMVWMWR